MMVLQIRSCSGINNTVSFGDASPYSAAEKFQTLLDAAETETAQALEEGEARAKRLEEALAEASSEADGGRAFAQQLVAERDEHLENIAALEARAKQLSGEVQSLLPLKATARARTEADAAAVLAAKLEAREAARCVDDIEACVASLRTWALRAKANAKSRGWTDEEVEKAFAGFVEAAGRAGEAAAEAAARGFGGGAADATRRQLREEIETLASSEAEHDRAMELLGAEGPHGERGKGRVHSIHTVHVSFAYPIIPVLCVYVCCISYSIQNQHVIHLIIASSRLKRRVEGRKEGEKDERKEEGEETCTRECKDLPPGASA